MSGSKHRSTVATHRVDLREFAEQIVGAACLAPSLHNAQPWAFRVGPGEIEVYADRGRRVPVADPQDRQLFIGLGAAVLGLRLALGHLGLRPVVRLAREPDRPDLAAVVTAAGSVDADADEQLYPQLSRRRTVRARFTDDAVPLPVQIRLAEVAKAEGMTPNWLVQQAARRALASLSVEAERAQQADPAFRAELAHWTGPATAGPGAGIPPASAGGAARAGAGVAMRDFTGGGAPPVPAEPHPGILALCTPTDRRADWLRTGQALHHLLLVAAVAGYAASYVNQPLEIPRLRARVRSELGIRGHPQLILRIGRPSGPLPPPAPRRPIRDVLLTPTDRFE